MVRDIKMFIGGIPKPITIAYVLQLFPHHHRKYVQVEFITTDNERLSPRGCVFVILSHPATVEYARQLDGRLLPGMSDPMRVHEANQNIPKLFVGCIPLYYSTNDAVKDMFVAKIPLLEHQFYEVHMLQKVDNHQTRCALVRFKNETAAAFAMVLDGWIPKPGAEPLMVRRAFPDGAPTHNTNVIHGKFSSILKLAQSVHSKADETTKQKIRNRLETVFHMAKFQQEPSSICMQAQEVASARPDDETRFKAGLLLEGLPPCFTKLEPAVAEASLLVLCKESTTAGVYALTRSSKLKNMAVVTFGTIRAALAMESKLQDIDGLTVSLLIGFEAIAAEVQRRINYDNSLYLMLRERERMQQQGPILQAYFSEILPGHLHLGATTTTTSSNQHAEGWANQQTQPPFPRVTQSLAARFAQPIGDIQQGSYSLPHYLARHIHGDEPPTANYLQYLYTDEPPTTQSSSSFPFAVEATHTDQLVTNYLQQAFAAYPDEPPTTVFPSTIQHSVTTSPPAQLCPSYVMLPPHYQMHPAKRGTTEYPPAGTTPTTTTTTAQQPTNTTLTTTTATAQRPTNTTATTVAPRPTSTAQQPIKPPQQPFPTIAQQPTGPPRHPLPTTAQPNTLRTTQPAGATTLLRVPTPQSQATPGSTSAHPTRLAVLPTDGIGLVPTPPPQATTTTTPTTTTTTATTTTTTQQQQQPAPRTVMNFQAHQHPGAPQTHFHVHSFSFTFSNPYGHQHVPANPDRMHRHSPLMHQPHYQPAEQAHQQQQVHPAPRQPTTAPYYPQQPPTPHTTTTTATSSTSVSGGDNGGHGGYALSPHTHQHWPTPNAGSYIPQPWQTANNSANDSHTHQHWPNGAPTPNVGNGSYIPQPWQPANNSANGSHAHQHWPSGVLTPNGGNGSYMPQHWQTANNGANGSYAQQHWQSDTTTTTSTTGGSYPGSSSSSSSSTPTAPNYTHQHWHSGITTTTTSTTGGSPQTSSTQQPHFNSPFVGHINDERSEPSHQSMVHMPQPTPRYISRSFSCLPDLLQVTPKLTLAARSLSH